MFTTKLREDEHHIPTMLTNNTPPQQPQYGQPQQYDQSQQYQQQGQYGPPSQGGFQYYQAPYRDPYYNPYQGQYRPPAYGQQDTRQQYPGYGAAPQAPAYYEPNQGQYGQPAYGQQDTRQQYPRSAPSHQYPQQGLYGQTPYDANIQAPPFTALSASSSFLKTKAQPPSTSPRDRSLVEPILSIGRAIWREIKRRAPSSHKRKELERQNKLDKLKEEENCLRRVCVAIEQEDGRQEPGQLLSLSDTGAEVPAVINEDKLSDYMKANMIELDPTEKCYSIVRDQTVELIGKIDICWFGVGRRYGLIKLPNRMTRTRFYVARNIAYDLVFGLETILRLGFMDDGFYLGAAGFGPRQIVAPPPQPIQGEARVQALVAASADHQSYSDDLARMRQRVSQTPTQATPFNPSSSFVGDAQSPMQTQQAQPMFTPTYPSLYGHQMYSMQYGSGVSHAVHPPAQYQKQPQPYQTAGTANSSTSGTLAINQGQQ